MDRVDKKSILKTEYSGIDKLKTFYPTSTNRKAKFVTKAGKVLINEEIKIRQ